MKNIAKLLVVLAAGLAMLTATGCTKLKARDQLNKGVQAFKNNKFEQATDVVRSSAMGVFFMGIPLGVGCAFLLAGTFGASHGWRSTFYALGIAGIVLAVVLACLKDERAPAATTSRP